MSMPLARRLYRDSTGIKPFTCSKFLAFYRILLGSRVTYCNVAFSLFRSKLRKKMLMSSELRCLNSVTSMSMTLLVLPIEHTVQ